MNSRHWIIVVLLIAATAGVAAVFAARSTTHSSLVLLSQTGIVEAPPEEGLTFSRYGRDPEAVVLVATKSRTNGWLSTAHSTFEAVSVEIRGVVGEGTYDLQDDRIKVAVRSYSGRTSWGVSRGEVEGTVQIAEIAEDEWHAEYRISVWVTRVSAVGTEEPVERELRIDGGGRFQGVGEKWYGKTSGYGGIAGGGASGESDGR